jgi:hypothetical protein
MKEGVRRKVPNGSFVVGRERNMMEWVSHIIPAPNMEERGVDGIRRRGESREQELSYSEGLRNALRLGCRDKGTSRTTPREAIQEGRERCACEGLLAETDPEPLSMERCQGKELISKPTREIGVHKGELPKDKQRVLEPPEG